MKGKCVLAGEHGFPYIQRLRKGVYEKGLRQKPHGFKFVTACGNPQCIAEGHLRLTPWASWGKKKQPIE